jgi:hypothetical protein
MAFAFEKLVVYQISVDFADSICIAIEQFRAATASRGPAQPGLPVDCCQHRRRE